METIKKKLSDSAVMRWIVLVLLAMLTFSTYWFQDFFSGLKPLMESELGFSSTDFGLMISATTWANLAGMIIVGGIILDKWGIRISGIIFGGLATLGAAITALAASGFFGDDPNTQLTWMIVGRILFGTGLETVCVLVSRTIVKWFRGHELALAFAVNMGFGRLGSALGTAISIDIAGNHISPAVNFAATLIGIAMIGFLVYLIFDIKLDKQIGKKQKDGEEKFKFTDLIKLVSNRSFILIALLCVSFYAAVFPFMQYAPDLLVNKFGFSYDLPKGAVIELFGNATLGNAMIYIVLFIFGLAFSL
ncbi:MAG: MFS transporter, partial [Bacteroidales bacterium]|nr:MFS transporter [Bacteroidales bacterium]